MMPISTSWTIPSVQWTQESPDTSLKSIVSCFFQHNIFLQLRLLYFSLLVFMWLLFKGSYNSRAVFISLTAYRHQQWLDKIHTGDTVTTGRSMHSLSSCFQESYNTNRASPVRASPVRANPVTVIRNYSHTCACHVC